MKRRRRKRLPAGALRAYFHDEAPRIGCGWRLVLPLKIGRKWARIQEFATGVCVRLPVKVWLAIAKTARPASGGV
jgi:hypothetical protein